MLSQKSSIQSTQKPVNIFYIWYGELCRRLNSNPAPAVKPAKPKCQTVLDFVADRLKVEEWHPVINALKYDTSLHIISMKSRIGNCQFLHDIDTEDKARRMKRRYGHLWTAYILRNLLKSLSHMVRNNEVLSCLEFDGFPLFVQYLEPFLKALKKNKTLKNFSLSNCHIQDSGCQLLCDYLKMLPNIEVINLAGCGLTGSSGEYLANLIKYQQINRYCESWHNSLRYVDPDAFIMCGIKRITLNRNPYFGDYGLNFILDQLDDDLWLKALDVQKCGITEEISMKIIHVVQYNRSLEIVDLRLNDQLHISTIEKILNILKQKQTNHQTEFQWCNTSVTLALSSVSGSTSQHTSITANHNQIQNQVHKTKSAPNKKVSNLKGTGSKNEVRKTKTLENIPKKVTSNYKLNETSEMNKKIEALNSQLQEAIAKRIETEIINENLKRKLSELNGAEILTTCTYRKSEANSLISAIQNVKIKPNGVINGENNFNTKNGFNKEESVSLTKKASHLFQEMVSKQNESESEEEDLWDQCLKNHNDERKRVKENCEDSDEEGSQLSLYKYMDKLKSDSEKLCRKPIKSST